MTCPAENISDDYIGESARGIIERAKNDCGRDTKSHVLKHSSEKENVDVTQEVFKLLEVILKTTDSKRGLLRHY